jgi:hypothetical protein
MASRWTSSLKLCGVLLSLALTACGGASSDATSFAEKVGVTPAAPAPSPTPAPAPAPAPAPKVWVNAHWVDFQNGNDNNDGNTKATAWKHAPGDPNATGVAAAYRPAAGDQIVFAAGSRYFGSITAEVSGTDAAPITYTGESESVPSVIDGTAFSAAARRCASQSECGGIAAWRNASVAVFAQQLPDNAIFYADGQMLTPAQWPDPANLFYADELSEMAEVSGTAIASGTIAIPSEVAAGLTLVNGLKVAVWVQPNVIEERAVTSVANGRISFDATGLQPYTDRSGKFAIRGHSSTISMAGEFAIMPDRRTVVFVTAGPTAAVTASTGRSGIDLSGANNVVVRDLSFENFSDQDGNIRSGMPIWASRRPATKITIERNRFANLFLVNGQGAITMQRTTGLTIRGNTIRTVSQGSGMRLTNSSNILVEANSIERVGRTAVYLGETTDSVILRNRIRDVQGIHGNGISVYLGSRNTRVIANTVTEALRPVTIKGNGANTPAAEDILFANNLLVTTRNSLGAFISWGANGRRIRLYNNVILGAEKGSVRLDADDFDLRIERNVIDGITYNRPYSGDWVITNNAYRLLGVFQNQFANVSTTSALPPQLNSTGAAPSDLRQFCTYISEPLDLIFGTRYDRNVGAEFVCS